MQAFWWTLFIATLAGFAYNLATYVRHRRPGTPIPTWAAGNVSSTGAMLLLLTGELLGATGPVAIAALCGGIALLGASVVLMVRARRSRSASRPT